MARSPKARHRRNWSLGKSGDDTFVENDDVETSELSVSYFIAQVDYRRVLMYVQYMKKHSTIAESVRRPR